MKLQTGFHAPAEHYLVGKVFSLVPNNQVASVLMRKYLFVLSVYEKIEGVYVTGSALLPCLRICSCKT